MIPQDVGSPNHLHLEGEQQRELRIFNEECWYSRRVLAGPEIRVHEAGKVDAKEVP